MSRHLFDYLDDVGSTLTQAKRVMLFSDYDGTLAPIAAEPDFARLRPEMRELLRGLATNLGLRVSIVSGRALGDLRERVGLEELTYSGNHGLEISGPGIAFVHPRGHEHASLLSVLAEALEPALAPIEGAWIENKGFTMSVHFRQAPPGRFREVCDIVQSAAEPFREQLQLTLGRKVFDIRPNVNWNKGDAIAWIRAAYRSVDAVPLYMGDDTTDEEAFASLPDGITIRVSPAGESRAAYHLEDPTQVESFLLWLTRLAIRRHWNGG